MDPSEFGLSDPGCNGSCRTEVTEASLVPEMTEPWPVAGSLAGSAVLLSADSGELFSRGESDFLPTLRDTGVILSTSPLGLSEFKFGLPSFTWEVSEPIS